ncbi:hypothetical protein ABTD43_18655, partial [Acinetobacter baumannii]
ESILEVFSIARLDQRGPCQKGDSDRTFQKATRHVLPVRSWWTVDPSKALNSVDHYASLVQPQNFGIRQAH